MAINWFAKICNYAKNNGFPLCTNRRRQNDSGSSGTSFAEGNVNLENVPTTSCKREGTVNDYNISYYGAQGYNSSASNIIETAAKNAANHPVRFVIGLCVLSLGACLLYKGCNSSHQDPKGYDTQVQTTQNYLYDVLDNSSPSN